MIFSELSRSSAVVIPDPLQKVENLVKFAKIPL
jgi:hypothetical protein